jgi:LysR family glycine cleavage system transcriptional activator
MAISIRSLPLNALRSFDAAARHLSFAAAANELTVTPAAISAQIRRLEEWVGLPLFLRGHRSIALTVAGARLAPRLTNLFLDMERLLTETAEIDADSLQLSTIQSFAAKWLAPRIASFTDRYPTLQLRISGDDRQVDLDRDDVDVAIRYGDGDHGDLHAERIARAVAFPVCSPQIAARYADPAEIPAAMLLQDESSLVSPDLPTWEAWFGAAGVAHPAGLGGVLFRNSHMALAAALAGQGFALGLSPLVDLDLAEGRLVRPFELSLESPFGFWFVCRRDRLGETKIAAFRQWLFEEAARVRAPLA